MLIKHKGSAAVTCHVPNASKARRHVGPDVSTARWWMSSALGVIFLLVYHKRSFLVLHRCDLKELQKGLFANI